MGDKKKRPPCFKLEIPGDEDARMHVYERLHKVRGHLSEERNRPVNNYDILDYLLKCFQEKHGKETAWMSSIVGREIKLTKTKTSKSIWSDCRANFQTQCKG